MQHPFFHEKNISEIIAGISRVAQYLWDKGWAERNAGNISVNITPFLPAGDEYFPVHSFKSLEPAGGSIKNQMRMGAVFISFTMIQR
jgi:ribulose-5-phosphate 4-epimerase/fuculose-1-phosphate aldolase